MGQVPKFTMITKHFELLLNKKVVPEVRDEGKGYSMWDDGGVEAEVGVFLYGMVRVLKPKLILETGLYTGVSCSYMAQGLSDNGFGCITSVEYEQVHINTARERMGRLGLDRFVNFNLSDSLEFNPNLLDTEKFGLVLLDTELHLRFKELVKFFPMIEEGGYIFIHDMPVTLCQGNVNPDHPEFKNWPVGEIPQEVTNWVKDGQLRPIYFPSPRGLMGFYKSRSDEHKWV